MQPKLVAGPGPAAGLDRPSYFPPFLSPLLLFLKGSSFVEGLGAVVATSAKPPKLSPNCFLKEPLRWVPRKG